MDRRTWLKLAAAAAAFPFPPLFAQPVPDDSQPFSEDILDAKARQRRDEPYKVPEKRVDEALASLTYEQYINRPLVYKEDQAIFRKDEGSFWIEPYHTAGTFFAYPVELYSVEAGRAFRIPYSAAAFDFPSDRRPPTSAQSDFAGFRALTPLDRQRKFMDFLQFLGASNFKAVAASQVFGVSARAFAINTGQPGGEEFPLFRSLWIERPKPADQSLVVHALIDSASAVGRFKFVATPGFETVIDTEAVIYPRRRLAYVGIAPIASHFFFGPGVPPKRRDYRPRVHDSEALYIFNGRGEQIWRPLLNPERLQFSVFLDKNPKGFGLVQKERSFSSYQDTEQLFDRRPTLWIEPLEDWGEGSIDLIELPALENINENIVCFWRPKDGLNPGIRHPFRYRMHWGWNPPFQSKKAAVEQTRVGEARNGDVVFILDFSNTELCEGCGGGSLAPKVTSSAGEIRPPRFVAPPPGVGLQRVRFEFVPAGSDPIDLRGWLEVNDKVVSDTWIFRWAR